MGTEGRIYAALAEVMNEITAIGKDKRNTQQGFNYRGIDDVYNSLNPLLAKHKVFVCPEIIDRAREERTNQKGTVLAFVTLTMRYTFYTDDGSSVSCTVCGEGMDSGDKATNKAMAVAHKYALLQTFCIPTEDMPDPDQESHDLAATRKKAKENNPEPPSEKTRSRFFALMRQRHQGITDPTEQRAAMLADVSSFLGRSVASSNSLTQADMSAFIEAVEMEGAPDAQHA